MACVILIWQYGLSTVFAWIPMLVLGGVLGVLVGAAVPQRPTWAMTTGDRPVGIGALAWTMRVTLLVSGTVAVLGYLNAGPARLLTAGCSANDGSGLAGPVYVAAITLTGVSWALAECALVLLERGRRIPLDGADVAVDDATRSAIVHTAVGSATLLGLASIAVLGVGTGLTTVSGNCASSGTVGALLLTLGLSAAIGIVAMGGILVRWGSQLRKIADYVHKATTEDKAIR